MKNEMLMIAAEIADTALREAKVYSGVGAFPGRLRTNAAWKWAEDDYWTRQQSGTRFGTDEKNVDRHFRERADAHPQSRELREFLRGWFRSEEERTTFVFLPRAADLS